MLKPISFAFNASNWSFACAKAINSVVHTGVNTLLTDGKYRKE